MTQPHDLKERLYLHMEDWDNAELYDSERDEQLMEAVQTFNEREAMAYDKYRELRNYKSWQRERNQPDY